MRTPIAKTRIALREKEHQMIRIKRKLRECAKRLSPLETDLSNHEERLTALMKAIPDTIYFKDEQSRFISISESQTRLLGLNRAEEAVGKTDFDFFPREFAQQSFCDEQRILRTGQPLVNKIEQIRIRDGAVRWVTATKIPIWDPNRQKIVGLVGISRDITHIKETTDALKQSENRFRAIYEHAPVMIMAHAPDGQFILWNQQCAQVLGYRREEIEANEHWIRTLFPDTQEKEIFQEEMKQPTGSFREYRVEKRSGKTRIQMWAHFQLDDGSVIAIGYDVTEQKEAQSLIRHQATHDPLTDLPNRTFFFQLLDEEILLHTQTSTQGKMAICMLDLDHFKKINDTFGHDLGDHFLIEISRRIQYSIREQDRVCRLGGDEFAIFLNHIHDLHEARVVATRLLERVQQPWHSHQASHQVTCSMGISLFPEQGHDANTLLTKADIAMYEAKNHGRNQLRFFKKGER